MGYSTLLFLHVTSAFTMVTAAGLFLAIALAQRYNPQACTLPTPVQEGVEL